jgi:hypothetical protein
MIWLMMVAATHFSCPMAKVRTKPLNAVVSLLQQQQQQVDLKLQPEPRHQNPASPDKQNKT